ncbi:unnamed protein product [Schistosoma curassoni]|uniref:Trematode Eggshell Synthesis domain containing protein n=1 Tax=Schistosoma curassoni TaxID=6186 RepID=A0A183KCK7_9TREM|nr:unnamed protein product [Schistosoma curassoni]
MKIIILISFIFLPIILNQDINDQSNIFHSNDSRSTTTNNSWRVRNGNTNGEKKKGSFGGEFELSWFSGNSNRRYAFKEEGEANAKGNFNRHGRGEYDSMSTRSSRFKVKGSIDKYGRRTFQYSNLRRGGKRRSYSKRFSVDNFDINGDVYYKRKSMGLGSDSESAKHLKIRLNSDSDSDSRNSLETENSKSRSKRSDSQTENTTHRNRSVSTVGERGGF